MIAEKTAADLRAEVPGFERRKESYSVRWSAATVALDERTLEALAGRVLEAIPELNDLRVQILPGELFVTLSARRFGVPLSARATLTQLRFKDGFVAFVLDRLEALSFIPVPDALISFLVERAPRGLLTYYKDDHIMVVNVNSWMPGGLDLSLDRAEFRSGEILLYFGEGGYDLTDLLGAPDS